MVGRNQSLGAAGESVVAAQYERLGWTVVDRNWRTRDGEIDLIAVSGSTVVFCEVKTRSSVDFGGGAAAVTHIKQSRIRKVALAWLAGSSSRWSELRFDVAVVSAGSHGFAVEVIESAF